MLGTIMGTRMAPMYTNLFVGKLEWEFLRPRTRYLLCGGDNIDDDFAVWTPSEEPLCLFVENLNSYHKMIKIHRHLVV